MNMFLQIEHFIANKIGLLVSRSILSGLKGASMSLHIYYSN